MNTSWGIAYQASGRPERDLTLSRNIGFVLLAIALGGIAGPFIPAVRLEANYAFSRFQTKSTAKSTPTRVTFGKILGDTPVPTPASVQSSDGTFITPTNQEFSLVIPKIGINAPVIANVDPTKPESYDAALLQGVAHASTSYLPDQNGTVYLFSHSTNYDWFVKDLNAVFYLLKNLNVGDQVAIVYKRQKYSYTIRETKVVSPQDVSYLVPVVGKKNLILETCWPPGATTKRLLVFADLTK